MILYAKQHDKTCPLKLVNIDRVRCRTCEHRNR